MEDLLVQENLLARINRKVCVKLSDSYYTIAHNLIAMIVQKLPYILFRSYSSYGYLTDNRNFGYDTASHSCKKVGELILSKTLRMFQKS